MGEHSDIFFDYINGPEFSETLANLGNEFSFPTGDDLYTSAIPLPIFSFKSIDEQERYEKSRKEYINHLVYAAIEGQYQEYAKGLERSSISPIGMVLAEFLPLEDFELIIDEVWEDITHYFKNFPKQVVRFLEQLVNIEIEANESGKEGLSRSLQVLQILEQKGVTEKLQKYLNQFALNDPISFARDCDFVFSLEDKELLVPFASIWPDRKLLFKSGPLLEED